MLPTPHTLGVKRLTSGEEDAHGNASSTFGDAADWHVHAIAPGSMQEPATANRDLSLVAWSVLAPDNDELPTERDVVVLDGEEYAVNGQPQDFTRGPWENQTAGVVVELRRAEG